jgi:zinc transporter 9
VILCEDVAALTGVCIAFTAVSLSHVLNSPFYDSVGSISIGILLGTAAIYIIRTNAMNLMGRSLPERKREQIIRMLKNDLVVRFAFFCSLLTYTLLFYKF